MTLLSDQSIQLAIDKGELVIVPFRAGDVQPSSYDVHLASQFRVFRNHVASVIDPRQDQADLTETIDVGSDVFVLHPGEFVLAATIEQIKLGPCLAAQLNGKSSLARIGLVIHQTAGFFDPGFRGTATLELSNAATLPILLYPGMAIGQFSFFRLSTPALRPYGSEGLGSKYLDQYGPTASQYHKNADWNRR